jgi:hypothetical protein
MFSIWGFLLFLLTKILFIRQGLLRTRFNYQIFLIEPKTAIVIRVYTLKLIRLQIDCYNSIFLQLSYLRLKLEDILQIFSLLVYFSLQVVCHTHIFAFNKLTVLLIEEKSRLLREQIRMRRLSGFVSVSRHWKGRSMKFSSTCFRQQPAPKIWFYCASLPRFAHRSTGRPAGWLLRGRLCSVGRIFFCLRSCVAIVFYSFKSSYLTFFMH